MKRYTPIFLVIFIALGSFLLLTGSSSGVSGFSQSITLNPGWNILSTPRVVESHSFSATENSTNFDIYVLDAASVSGWATMADLGHSEFEPLYGYFINNKTGDSQALTLHYKSDLSPGERLFEREFTETGWYSFGPADPTYIQSKCSEVSDTNNISKILDSLSGSHSTVIDFTDANFGVDPESVAVTDTWKSVVPTDLDELNDLRELKGYAIYITNSGALYNGYQNEDAPMDVCPTPTPTGTVTVIKEVINDDGGTSVLEDFGLFVDNTSVSSGIPQKFDVGSYIVSEVDSGNYDVTFSGDCDSDGNITVEANQTYVCTITNDDIPTPTGTLAVFKQVFNDDSGTSAPGDFSLFVDTTQVASGVPQQFEEGTYTISETGPDGYDAMFSGDCDSDGNITIEADQAYVCTITNDDEAPQPLAISLAPGNPDAVTVTNNAKGLEVLRLRFSGTGILDEITISRRGAGTANDFSNVYLYDGNMRLTSGKTLGSATSEVTFVNLNLLINGEKELSVVVDMGWATAGNVSYFEVQSSNDVILENGFAVAGIYPVAGNNIYISGATGGTVTVQKVGSIPNPMLGQDEAEIAEFKLTTSTEGGIVKRMRFINGGNLSDSQINNIVLKDAAGNLVGSGAMNGNGYLDLVFSGGGYHIPVGTSEIFNIFADLGGNYQYETIKLYLEIDADTYVEGELYGFGMAVTDTQLDTASEAHSLTMQNGNLTISQNGPAPALIGTNTNDTILAKFIIVADNSIELKRHQLTICIDVDGDGTWNNASGSAGFADLEDIKISDVNTGAVLVGPVDGSSFTTASASACASGKGGYTRTFTDAFDILGGQTLNLAVTADVKAVNTGTYPQLIDGSIVKLIIESYADQAGVDGNLTVAKYLGTNIAVKGYNIVPGTDLPGPEMKIHQSTLTLGLSDTVNSDVYVKGYQNVEAVGITFKASLASAVLVKKVTLTGVSGASNGALSVTNVNGLISSIKLYDGDTGALINADVISNTLSSDGKIQFDNLNWLIPAGSTKTLLVKINLSTNTVPTNDTFAFDIHAAADVTALGSSSSPVIVTGADVNGSTTATVAVTVLSSGSMTGILSPSAPSTAALYWGQSGAEVAQYRFTSANEAFFIEKLTFGASVGDVADMANNIKSVTLEYTSRTGNTMTVTQSMTSGASVNFGFSGDNRPYVPRDSFMDIRVLANMKTESEGATTTSVVGSVSPNWQMRYHDTYNGSATNGFRAVGEGSGTVLNGNSVGVDNEVAANRMYVYRVFPKFEQVFLSAGEPLGLKDVFKFTITAMGLTDSKLFFDSSTAGSGSITFAVHASGDSATTNITPKTYSGSKTYDNTSVISGAGDDPTNHASYTMDFGENSLEITGGQSKTLTIEIAFTSFTDKSDYLQIRLLNDEDGLVNWVDNSTNSSGDSDVSSITDVLNVLPMNGQTFSKL